MCLGWHFFLVIQNTFAVLKTPMLIKKDFLSVIGVAVWNIFIAKI